MLLLVLIVLAAEVLTALMLAAVTMVAKADSIICTPCTLLQVSLDRWIEFGLSWACRSFEDITEVGAQFRTKDFHDYCVGLNPQANLR